MVSRATEVSSSSKCGRQSLERRRHKLSSLASELAIVANEQAWRKHKDEAPGAWMERRQWLVNSCMVIGVKITDAKGCPMPQARRFPSPVTSISIFDL